MQKDSNGSKAVGSVRPEESMESDRSDGEEDQTTAMENATENTVADSAADVTTAKRVVFGGTYPIDRPLSLNFGAAGTSAARRQQMSLTLKTPRTFAIDEPIREDHSAEVRSVGCSIPIGSI